MIDQSFNDAIYGVKFAINKVLRCLAIILSVILFLKVIDSSVLSFSFVRIILNISLIIFITLIVFSNKRHMGFLLISIMLINRFFNIDGEYTYVLNIINLTNVLYLLVSTIFFIRIKYRFLGKTL